MKRKMDNEDQNLPSLDAPFPSLFIAIMTFKDLLFMSV